jgi:peptidylprolyl isomerase
MTCRAVRAAPRAATGAAEAGARGARSGHRIPHQTPQKALNREFGRPGNPRRLAITPRAGKLPVDEFISPLASTSAIDTRNGRTMAEAKAGDVVTIHYTGTLEDGSVFDSSEGRDPLEFTVASGQIIPGLDREIPGMSVGDTKKVVIAPEDAYGPVHPEAKQAVPRADIPDHIPLEIGLPLQVQTPEGRNVQVTVAEIDDEQVVLDANHPLAGQTLTFEIELMSIGATA